MIDKKEWADIVKSENNHIPDSDWGLVTTDYFKVNSKTAERIWIQDTF